MPARLRSAQSDQYAVVCLPADRCATSTARLDWWNQVSTVFPIGDLKVMPYAVLDLTYYSSDLAGNEIGRVYGGGGDASGFELSPNCPLTAFKAICST